MCKTEIEIFENITDQLPTAKNFCPVNLKPRYGLVLHVGVYVLCVLMCHWSEDLCP